MRAVIVKTSAMGDVAQALSVAQYLKRKQGVSTVGWVVEEAIAPLVESYPYVDVVMKVDSKRFRSSLSSFSCVSEWCRQRDHLMDGEWDVAFDLQGNTKSMLINMCLQAKEKIGYGWRTAPERLNTISTTKRINPPQGLSIRNEYLWLAQSYFKDTETVFTPESVSLSLTHEQQKAVSYELKRWPQDREKPVWVVSAGSRWANKKCSPSSMLYLLERAYDQLGGIFFVFVAGSYDELKEVGYFASRFLSSSVVLFKPELPILAELIKNADRVVAMDSLVLHLASLTHTPTFGFFGPSSSIKYGPQRPFDGFFQGKCPLGNSFSKRCNILRTCSTGACLKEASLETMLSSLMLWNQQASDLLLKGQNQRIAQPDQLPVGSSSRLLSVSSP